MKHALYLLVTLTACAVTQPSTHMASGLVVLRGVRVIDGQGGPALDDQSIVLEGEHIREVGPRASLVVPANARIVELDGKTVYPGLVSDHSHVGLTDGIDSGRGHYTRENVRRQLRQYAAYGVTTVCSLGMNTVLFYDLQREVRGLPYADLFGADRGIGVPGAAPPVDVDAEQLYRPGTPDEARAAVREMAARKPTFIKIWVDDFHGTLPKKMSPDVYRAVIDEAHRAGIRVAAHVYYLEDARNLVQADIDVLAHGVRDREIDDALAHEMKRKHVWYVATIDLDESGHIFALAPGWTKDAFVRHALQPAVERQIDDPAWRQKILDDQAKLSTEAQAVSINERNLKRLFEAGVSIGFGTDSGATAMRVPGVAEHRELELMVQAGFTPLEALHVATHDAAELLGLTDRGTIAPGQLADLVVVDGKPDTNILDTRRILSVWKRGHEITGGVTAFQP